MRIGQKSWEVDVIPISWAIDGDSPPVSLDILEDGNKARYRDFNIVKDVFFEWQVPYGIVPSEGIFFQVEGWITNSTAPVNGETVLFRLKGVSLGDGDPLSSSLGSWVNKIKTFVTGAILTYSIPVPGGGYEVGDILTFSDGDGNATLRVLGVDGDGAVTDSELVNGGSGYEADTQDLDGGHGSGCRGAPDSITGIELHSRFESGWSEEVSIPNLAAGEIVILKLEREEPSRNYGQQIGVGWLKIKYARKSQQR